MRRPLCNCSQMLLVLYGKQNNISILTTNFSLLSELKSNLKHLPRMTRTASKENQGAPVIMAQTNRAVIYRVLQSDFCSAVTVIGPTLCFNDANIISSQRCLNNNLRLGPPMKLDKYLQSAPEGIHSLLL